MCVCHDCVCVPACVLPTERKVYTHDLLMRACAFACVSVCVPVCVLPTKRTLYIHDLLMRACVCVCVCVRNVCREKGEGVFHGIATGSYKRLLKLKTIQST